MHYTRPIASRAQVSECALTESSKQLEQRVQFFHECVDNDVSDRLNWEWALFAKFLRQRLDIKADISQLALKEFFAQTCLPLAHGLLRRWPTQVTEKRLQAVVIEVYLFFGLVGVECELLGEALIRSEPLRVNRHGLGVAHNNILRPSRLQSVGLPFLFATQMSGCSFLSRGLGQFVTYRVLTRNRGMLWNQSPPLLLDLCSCKFGRHRVTEQSGPQPR